MKTKADPKDRFVIIMAGGRGERFWPLSREKTPNNFWLYSVSVPFCRKPWIAFCRWCH
jgi:hypothetical protein